MPAQRHIIRITHEGKSHDLCLADLTVGQLKMFKREVGVYPMKVINAFRTQDADLPELAAFIWLSKMVGGERVDLEMVEAGLRYDTPVTLENITEGDAEPEASDPEA